MAAPGFFSPGGPSYLGPLIYNEGQWRDGIRLPIASVGWSRLQVNKKTLVIPAKNQDDDFCLILN